MRLRRGITLLELLVAFIASIFILLSLGFAYSSALKWQQTVPDRVRGLQDQTRFETRLRALISGAFLSANVDDTHSYFIASSSTGASEIADVLTFTTNGAPPEGDFLEASGPLDVLNGEYGPQTGLEEISLSTVPVGEAAPEAQGLFIRTQRPSDGDPTQGGYEQLLLDGVASLQFEFFDGNDWISTWDTRTGQRRLPAAVRIVYLRDGESLERVLTVEIPQSDVTPENPITVGDQGAAQ